MKKKLNINNLLQKTSLLQKNYTKFLDNNQNFNYSLQSFQRERQEYFFFKNSCKNVLQFLFRKGEKKKVLNLVKNIFIPLKNNKFEGVKNYKLYKAFYKVLFSNTPYMNLLSLPPKTVKRRGKRSGRNKNKILFLVPVLPRVQKRIQAS